MSALDDDPTPDHVLRDTPALLEPYREQVREMPPAARQAWARPLVIRTLGAT